MTEEAFQLFYEATARPLWSYLARVSGDRTLADDLMRESFLRLFRASGLRHADLAHSKNYLFRIATNLLHDHYRATARRGLRWEGTPVSEGFAERIEQGQDVLGVLETLSTRERSLLWLAYVEELSHREMSAILAVKEASVRPLLLRARRKLARALEERGLKP